MRIAIVDSTPQQRARISEALRAAQLGYSTFSSLQALSAEAIDAFDVLIYHWQPSVGSHHALTALRLAHPELPMLLVTGDAADPELADLLKDSWTDYLVKPVRAHDLNVRLMHLWMRRHPQPSLPPPLRFGRYAFDPERALAWHDEQPITLTRKEFALALLLFRHLGRPLSRATMHESVWPKEAEFSSRSLDTHIARIRQKFGLTPAQGYRLAPVYGYGYQLEVINFPEQNPVPQQV